MSGIAEGISRNCSAAGFAALMACWPAAVAAQSGEPSFVVPEADATTRAPAVLGPDAGQLDPLGRGQWYADIYEHEFAAALLPSLPTRLAEFGEGAASPQFAQATSDDDEPPPAPGTVPLADAGGPDLAALAQQTNNPIGDVWLLLTQNDTLLIGGDELDGPEVLNTVKFQPVLSFPILNNEWNMVVRPVLQIQSVPLDVDAGDLFGVSPSDIAADPDLFATASDPLGRTNGLGDTVLLTLAGPRSDDGWILAGGATQIFPTATEDVLGQGKWQAGPAALAVRLGNSHGDFDIESFNVGALVQHWWSYAGDDDRSSTSQSDIQYFLNWKLNETQLIGMTPNISINWEADGGFFDRAAIPVGIGTIGLFRIGDLPIRYGVEAQYYLTGADDIRREANFRVFFAPIIPRLF